MLIRTKCFEALLEFFGLISYRNSSMDHHRLIKNFPIQPNKNFLTINRYLWILVVFSINLVTRYRLKTQRRQPHLKYDYNNNDIKNLKQMWAKTEELMAEIKDESAEINWKTWKISCCKMRESTSP